MVSEHGLGKSTNRRSERTVGELGRAGSPKAWGGRFSESPDERVEALNASVSFDIRMVREDIRASISHVRMLA